MIKRNIATLTVFVIFLFLALGSTDDRTPEQKAQDACEDKILAFVMSQSFVEEKLKAPSTADFPSFSAQGVSVQYMGECTHRVVAFVDAENSFGAMIRTRYSAKLRYDKAKDSWHLEDFSM